MHKGQFGSGLKGIPLQRALLMCSAGAALFLSACAPDLGPKPEMLQPSALAAANSFASEQVEWPADNWWQAYCDP